MIWKVITLNQLAGRLHTGPGPYLESWPKIVLFFFVIALVAGTVAIWNRSHR